MATIDQMITITPLDTTLAAFDISAQSLVSVIGINSGADSSVKYVDNNRLLKIISVGEAPSVISAAAENLTDLTLLSDSSTIYVNVAKIKKMFTNGSGTQFFLDSEKAAWEPFDVTESMSTIQTAINALADTTPIPLAQHITDTTQSTSVASGAFVVDGGTGIAKNLYVGGLANVAGQVNAAAVTESTTSTTGALITAGGLGVAKAITGGSTITATTTVTATTGVITDSVTELTSGKGITMSKNIVAKKTLTALNTDGTITAAIVNKGGITSTSAAAVLATLDTATAIGTQIGAVAGTSVDFVVDNTAGANIVTVAVAAGITVCSGVVTGSNTLTVSVANAIGVFRLVFSSATVAKLYRVG